MQVLQSADLCTTSCNDNWHQLLIVNIGSFINWNEYVQTAMNTADLSLLVYGIYIITEGI